MSKNKYLVTVNGWFKLLATVFFISFTCAKVFPASIPAGLALLAYSLLFVYLAVNGSNSKFAAWIADKNFFTAIFFMPTVLCAVYSAVIYFGSIDSSNGKNVHLAAFGALLTILSIPFAFIMLRVQGGIRRWNAFVAFVAFPTSLYILSILFPEKIAIAAGGATIIVFLVFFGFAVAQSIRDHRADDSCHGDEGKSGGYSAKWDGNPNSDVRNNVIHLRGTVIVEYSGELYKSNAEKAVKDLVNAYVLRVARDMKGYSVDDAELTIKYNRIN